MAAPRASSVIAAGERAGHAPFDTIILPHDGRYRRRITMRTENDFVFLLDLPEARHLRDGDGIVLDDGRVIRVVAAAEPVAEVSANDAHHLARIAWHIGNRHVPAEILRDRIRIEPDPIIEEMARGLGGIVVRVEAPFEPEGGAYEQAAAHGHAHESRAHEGHAHAGHDHGHAHHGHAHHAHDHHHDDACHGHDHHGHHHDHDGEGHEFGHQHHGKRA